jgi:steroid delta-isomerase-like uncharacterized protein
VSTTREETNKATVRRIDEVLNSGDLELIFATIDELMAPDALIHTPLRIEATGAELAKQLWARLLRAYPDLRIAIEDLIAEGDKVVSRNTVTGTNRGEFMGFPPTGKSVAYSEVIINRFVDGRIVETWAVVDILAQMRQLGAIPAGPEQPPVEAPRPAA